MQADVLTGGFADAPVEAARAFRAALDAMARPGRITQVSGAEAPGLSTAAAVLLLTLCDRETPLYLAPGCDSEALKGWIAFHTGAPLVPAEEAMVALGAWDALQPLGRYRIGSAEYPDRSVTLIVECADLRADGMRLTGPGIETSARVSLPEVAAFERNNLLFPLGWDCFFTSSDKLAALPRTTKVEAL
ncbi:carbon-phosphorus lyase subunit PhnH [Salipiger sp. CCB-MM3]|uniref:phosphonate C-P lyase system protein PhnH n=1 Tax=Salipiger sp. CCB-MM3 TaxID=1792508 RepID=UPI00080AA73A|nr:phosphonate C-P lyase system protein PhnH [Salipiger sp. CCB-MM3]ANT59453.1 carbon-phosphorus lyase subunit PhnH [Salipiger sp. CCB-MM3]